MTTQKEAYTIPEFAEAIGVSKQHIWNALRRGEIKKFKIMGRTLIPQTELQKLLDTAE
jgi:excisionase family DNA binding protein|tara:strand:- start:1642 stop:1815 length:174 start_codon:yes stop_codon:yes gene_type:complete